MKTNYNKSSVNYEFIEGECNIKILKNGVHLWTVWDSKLIQFESKARIPKYIRQQALEMVLNK